MRFRAIAALSALAIVGALVAAWADNPHFIRATASGPNNNGSLTVSFKEAGLGDNQLITYQASATARAVWVCVNGGGNHPQATNKEEIVANVSATGTFNSGRNGQVNASLTLGPPPSSLNCPPGQRKVLAFIEYTNVQIRDLTNGVTEGIPGTFTRTFFPEFL